MGNMGRRGDGMGKVVIGKVCCTRGGSLRSSAADLALLNVPFGEVHTEIRIGANTACKKKKETCSWSSEPTLCVPQLNPNTLLPDTAEPTSVEDVVNKDQCVLAVLGGDCTMLKVQ